MDRPSLLSVSISHCGIFDGQSPLEDRVTYSVMMAEVDLSTIPLERYSTDGGIGSLGTQAVPERERASPRSNFSLVP